MPTKKSRAGPTAVPSSPSSASSSDVSAKGKRNGQSSKKVTSSSLSSKNDSSQESFRDKLVLSSQHTASCVTGCGLLTLILISVMISLVGMWTTIDGKTALAHHILTTRNDLVSTPLSKRGIFWRLQDLLMQVTIELPGFVVGFNADRASMYHHFEDESEGFPVPFRGSYMVFSHKDVSNVLTSTNQKRGVYLGAQPVPSKCMNSDTLIFESTGAVHTQLRSFLLDHIPAFRQSDPRGTLLDLDFGTDVGNAKNPSTWISYSPEGETEFANMVQRTLVRTLFRSMYQSDMDADTLAAFMDYASLGATCVLGSSFHSATFGIIANKVDALRVRIRKGILATPFGQELKEYARQQAALGNLPNTTTEEQAGDNIIRQLADGSAFAGMLGTSHLTLHALRRLRSDPSRYVPLFKKDPVAFLHEEARVDPPVTSVTAVLGEDAQLNLYPHHKTITFEEGTPYQLVLSTANMDPLVFGGTFHSRAEAMRFNPSRENMGESVSWNGRLEDVAAFQAPRGCPGYKLSMLLARSVVTHFAPSAGALPVPLDPVSTAARSRLSSVDQSSSSSSSASPSASSGSSRAPVSYSTSIPRFLDKLGFSIWFFWCTFSIGFLYGKGGIGSVSVRYMHYLAFQAVSAVGCILDLPTLFLFGEMIAGTAYVLIFLTIALQHNPSAGRRYSLAVWATCFILIGMMSAVIARVGIVPTLEYISRMYYSICAIIGVTTMVLFYFEEKKRQAKDLAVAAAGTTSSTTGSSVTDAVNSAYNVWTLRIPSVVMIEGKPTFDQKNLFFTHTFTYGELAVIGAFFGIVDLGFVFVPTIGHLVSRILDCVFYVTPILFVVQKMDRVYLDGTAVLPRWRSVHIVLTTLAGIVLVVGTAMVWLWTKAVSGDICAFEYTYPSSTHPHAKLCTSTPLTRDMDDYGRFTFFVVKTFVGSDPVDEHGRPIVSLGAEEFPSAVKLPKYDRPLGRLDVFPNPGGFHLTIPTEDEDVEDEASWIFSKVEDGLHALLKSTTIFPFRDSDVAWRDVDQAHAALALAGGNKLPAPVTNWTNVDVESDVAISMMVFAGFAGTRLVKITDEERVSINSNNDSCNDNSNKDAESNGNWNLSDSASSNDIAVWKCDFRELLHLEVRPNFERFGATAYFNKDRQLISIFWAAPGIMVTPNDEPTVWAHAKFVWRSSALVGLTAIEHLMANHLIYSNIASTTARETLPKDHPIRRFLKPFNHRTPSVNMGAQKFLTTENCLLHRTLSLTYKGLTDAFRSALKSVRLNGNPLQHQIEASRELGDKFPFARDGLEFFAIIRDFVEQYVVLYYKSDEEVRQDHALMGMWNGVRVFGDKSGLPPWSKVTVHDLIDVTSTYIFHVTGLHHVVGNVAEYLMDPTFATGRLRAGRNIADVEASMYALLIAVMTGARAPKLMNDFSHLLLQDQHINETTAVLQGFQQNLTTFSVTLHERNMGREWKFYGFDPARLLSSVSI